MNYVMLKDGTILIDSHNHADGKSFHSSLVQRENPIAAGEIEFWGGRIKAINEKSGHYMGSGRLHYVEDELKAQGAEFTRDYNQR